VVRLRGVVPEGRICSNCCAKRRTGMCGCCDRVDRLVGRHPDGRRWCERCARRHRSATAAQAHRNQVVAAVAAIERQAALIQLAAEIPPAMLAGILGIHPTTAVKWTKLGGGNWTTYAAARSHRPEP
jgi:hypothetical protein